MKRIAITGGKGGTGKSTFSVLFASKLARQGKKVVLVDADVECPNDHLLVGKKLENGSPRFFEYPKLVEEKCVECGACAKACTRNAIFWIKGKKPLFMHHLCDSCGACFIACPQKAIMPEKKQVAEIFENQVNENFLLVSGKSSPEIQETSQIVNKARDHGLKKAKELEADYLLVDSAAGMHCSVISALVGAEKIFAVTEPTPLGEHDLRLMLGLIKVMGIPAEIVINKATVGNKELIKKLGKEKGIQATKEIPYSRELITAYSHGTLHELEGLL